MDVRTPGHRSRSNGGRRRKCASYPTPWFQALATAVLACLVLAIPVAVASAGPACSKIGTAGSDLLRGTPAKDVICGLGGTDKIYGLGGNDVLIGGAGNDQLHGGSNTDTLNGGPGADLMGGDSGIDAVTFSDSTGPVSVNLGTDHATGQGTDSVPGIENAIGSSGADTLTGDGLANRLTGGAGNDAEQGSGGPDALAGGTGNDGLRGGTGDDTISGNDGTDRLYGEPNDDDLSGGLGPDHLDGGAGVDACVPGDGVDTVAGSCEDTSAPSLTGFAISPTTVDTSGSQAQVDFRAQAKDDLSGIGEMRVDVRSPLGAGEGLGYWQLTLQDQGDGRAIADVVEDVEKGAPQGTYTVAGVTLTDKVGNRIRYSNSDLQAAGFDTSFQQVGAGDTTAPTLTSFSFSPAQVDTSGASAQIHFTATATDDLSGIEYVALGYRGPRGPTIGPNLTLASGTDLSGSWTGSSTLFRYSAKGTYTLTDVYVVDRAGNVTRYGTAALAAAGYPTTFEQTGADDNTPPVLQGLTISPTTIDTSTQDQTVNLMLHITDALAGVDGETVTADVKGPTGITYFPDYIGRLVSGTPQDGIWRVSIPIPRYAKHGTYTITGVNGSDFVYNGFYRDTQALNSAGFPTTFQNGP